MEEDEIMKLFNSYWFEFNIISNNKNLASILSETKGSNDTTNQLEPQESKIGVRALSDQSLRIQPSFYEQVSFSSSSKLSKIISGTELCDLDREIEEDAKNDTMKTVTIHSDRRRSRGNSKSLSELEIKELKGFMDLGFIFTEEDKTTSLVSILPGLRRWEKIATEIHKDEDGLVSIPRPYLSEAWEGMGHKKMNKTVTVPWSFPAMKNDITMKDHLKAWAHTVASTAR